MQVRINKEFQYKNATVVIRSIYPEHVIVLDVYSGDAFTVNKRTLDGLPEPDDEGKDEGRATTTGYWMRKFVNLQQNQRVLLEALQAAEDALKNIQGDAQYILQAPAQIPRVVVCAEVISNNCNMALDAIARTKTQYDDDVQVQS